MGQTEIKDFIRLAAAFYPYVYGTDLLILLSVVLLLSSTHMYMGQTEIKDRKGKMIEFYPYVYGTDC